LSCIDTTLNNVVGMLVTDFMCCTLTCKSILFVVKAHQSLKERCYRNVSPTLWRMLFIALQHLAISPLAVLTLMNSIQS
jgi:hypothetical protein